MTTSPSATACPLCGGHTHTTHLTKYGYTLSRCAGCGHIHVNPMPSDEELTAHYQNVAYFEGESDQGYRSYADMHRALKPHFERRLRLLNAAVTSGRTLMDFGCADGYFLDLARQHGWDISGVELSAEMASRASQRLSIPIAQRMPDAAQFDAITMWEVIEHVPQPVEHLRQLRALLRPGGSIAISTPNTGHWQAVRAHDEWVSYRPPSHLQYFTEATLRSALQNAGFDNITIRQTMPLPPLPAWLKARSSRLYKDLGLGQAKNWRVSLWLWRAVRGAAWIWQKLAHPQDNIFTTLEVVATRANGPA